MVPDRIDLDAFDLRALLRFNGAGTFWSRIGPSTTPPSGSATGFNGAGTFWSRIDDAKAQAVAKAEVLQWGRDLLVPDSAFSAAT